VKYETAWQSYSFILIIILKGKKRLKNQEKLLKIFDKAWKQFKIVLFILILNFLEFHLLII